MYELANQIRIKDLPVFKCISTVNMVEDHLILAYKNGVDVGELAANVYVYQLDDLICQVEYIKMICRLVKIFRDIFDNNLYNLRLQGYVNDEIYSVINFHNIFNEVNNQFNYFVDDEYIFAEVEIYHSEIALETSISLYESFNDTIINQLSNFIDSNLLKFTFNKNNIKYLYIIYDKIMISIENVFLIY